MNAAYHFARMRELLDEFEPSRERSLAATKLDECELWLDRCQRTQEALTRDQAAPDPKEATAATGGATRDTAPNLTDLSRYNPAGSDRFA